MAGARPRRPTPPPWPPRGPPAPPEGAARAHRAGYSPHLSPDRPATLASACAQANHRFRLSLHYTAPHWPWETREDGELAKKFGRNYPIYHLDGGTIHAYRRM